MGAEIGYHIHVHGKARVFVCVGKIDGFARAGDDGNNAAAVKRYADFGVLQPAPLGDFGPEFILFYVFKVNGAASDIQHFSNLLGNDV